MDYEIELGEPDTAPTTTHCLYVDEAGIHQESDRSIFVGIVAPIGTQTEQIHGLISQLADRYVPKGLRSGYIFHATDVYNGQNKKNGAWDKIQRLEFIEAMCALPASLGLPICVGTHKRNFFVDYKSEFPAKIDLLLLENMSAFANLLGAADRYMSRSPLPAAKAKIICEEAGQNNNRMRRILHYGQRRALIFDPKISPPRKDLIEPDLLQLGRPVLLKADGISGEITFEKKNGSPLLQCADACAFALNRYLNHRRDGQRFIERMHHRQLHLSDWSGPASSVVLDGDTFPPETDWSSGRPFLRAS